MADDPATAALKRHEYYLRNRKLKGRAKAVKRVASKRPAMAKPPVKTRAQRQAERRKHLEAQVAALKGRLEKLRAVLKQETEKAQARSGVKPKNDPVKAPASQQKSSGNAPKLTAAQKAKKAKEDKKRREENPDQQLADDVKSLTEKIKTIQERIAKMRKPGSVGARKNQSK